MDLALQHLPLQGPPLRVRYRFTLTDCSDIGDGRTCGYDLELGHGVRAHPADPPTTHHVHEIPEVTLTQPLALAAAVAAGQESAQRALLRGDITVTGDVTALLGWVPALDQIDAAMGPLRSRTDWSDRTGGVRSA